LRKIAVASLIFILSAAGAAISFFKTSHLRAQASSLYSRADAPAVKDAPSLDSSVDPELMTFDQRRALLDRANPWQRFEIFCALVAVASALAGYSFYLLQWARRCGVQDEVARR
jgi:hypothetical protein